VVGVKGDQLFHPWDYGIRIKEGASTACYRGFISKFGLDKENRLILCELSANVVNCKTDLGRNIYEGTRLVLELQRALEENNGEESEETRRLQEEIERLHKAMPSYENHNEYYRNLIAFSPDEAPTLNGVAAICDDSLKFGGCGTAYKNVALLLGFTGSILIGADFDDAYYVHMGYQDPIGYNELWELEFKNGALQKAVDRSNAAAKVRKSRNGRGLDILERAQGDGIKAVADAIDDSFDLASDSKWDFWSE
ncbi:MAG: hypothetical protein IJE97_00305, partial [Thermoguttaceae bacterium]|nr:hypothetical protein [Thermoguttaceae bacterium]